MRILFLNQYFPPDPAPTGVLLDELARHVAAAGHAVDFVDAQQDYRGGQRRGGRMVREAIALARMFWAGICRPKADVVISATSPPCLLLVATLVAFWHRAKSVHWIMDLYPEIAVALGEIPEGTLSRSLRQLMAWAYRRCAAVVVLDEDMEKRLEATGARLEIIRPWVFSSVQAILDRTPDRFPVDWTWTYSGNLGRAHEWKTMLDAQAILEKQGAGIRLLIQGGGPARPAAEQYAQDIGLKQCTWTGYLDESELPSSLLGAQVLVVSQLPAAQGMLWPSKLGLLLSLPRPILWVGPVDGAIADVLRRAPQAGVFGIGQGDQIAQWLTSLKARGQRVSRAIDPRVHRDKSLHQWQRLLEGLA